MSEQEQTNGKHTWTRTTLGVALPIRYGKARSEKHGVIREGTAVYGSSGVIDSFERALTSGPTLIIGRKGTVGATHYSPEPCWPIDTVYFAEAEPDKDLRFFKYLLDHLQLRNMDRSTAVPGLSRDDYNAKEVYVPRLDDQRRIVAEIEMQFTRLDAGVAGLRRVQANLKRYRAAVLKAACEGKLVPTEAELARQEGRTLPAPCPGVFFVYAIRCDNDSIYVGQTQDLQKRWQEHLAGQAADWTSQRKPVLIVHYEEYSSREEAVAREKWLKTGFGRKWLRREIAAGRARQAGYETGAQLLERILTERRKNWNGKGTYKAPATPETKSLSVLPNGWIWATAEQICQFITKGTTPRADKLHSGSGEIQFLKVYNLTFTGRLDHNYKPAFIDRKTHDGELARSKIKSGDVLINIVGPPLGQVAVVPDDVLEANINQAIARFTPLGGVSNHFLSTAFQTRSVMSWAINRAKTTAGQANLTLELCRELPVPLPPVAEQQRVVAEVDRRLSVVEELEAVVNANLQRATRLRQSILQRAFEGNLSPTWQPRSLN